MVCKSLHNPGGVDPYMELFPPIPPMSCRHDNDTIKNVLLLPINFIVYIINESKNKER